MRRPLLALALLAPLGVVALGQGAPLPTNAGLELKAALKDQVAGLNAEDPERVLRSFHSRARGREEAHKGLVAMFRGGDTRYVIESYQFIGVDEPYAYARTLQASGEASQGPSQRTEQLQVFRREGSEWKFWTSVVLDSPPVPKRR